MPGRTDDLIFAGFESSGSDPKKLIGVCGTGFTNAKGEKLVRYFTDSVSWRRLLESSC